MRIQNNIMAMNTHRMYSVNNSAVQRSAEKLSSGYRVNRAGDDAAGLAISEKMRAQIRGLNMASKNSQDAVSLVQTAEGALQEVHAMLQRMNELAVQSASGTNETKVDRAALQQEFQNLQDEIDEISKTTKFNDMAIMDGSYGKNPVQDPDAEVNPGAYLPDPAAETPTVIGAATFVQEGKLAVAGTATYDLTGLADSESVTINGVTVTNTDGEFGLSGSSNVANYTAALSGSSLVFTQTAGNEGTVTPGSFGEIAKDGTSLSENVAADIVDGSAAQKAQATFALGELSSYKAGDKIAIGDAEYTVTGEESAWTDVTATGTNWKFTVASDGTATAEQVTAAALAQEDIEAMSATKTAAPSQVEPDDGVEDEPAEPLKATVNADAVKDFGTAGDKITISSKDGTPVTFTVGDEYGTEGATITDLDSLIEAINADTDLGWTASGDATTGLILTAQDGNTATTNPITALTSNGTEQDVNAVTEVEGGEAEPTGNGLVIQTGAEEGQTLTIYIEAMNTKGLGLEKANVDISTQETASKAITATRNAINKVSTQRAELGAMQNRLEHKIQNLDNTSENLSAAESRIRDVDMAKEMTEFTKQNILSQAATAMLAQANAAPQGVLSLLQ